MSDEKDTPQPAAGPEHHTHETPAPIVLHADPPTGAHKGEPIHFIGSKTAKYQPSRKT